jgi:L-ascorbate metabolism protein UlaG (beta-lactamase superfamily)
MEFPQNSIRFLGQAGFWIRNQSSNFLIDPYLSNYVVDGGIGPAELFSREFPVPVEIEEMRGVDYVFVTHDHADHCDPDTLLPLLLVNPGMKIVCPFTAKEHLLRLGVSPSAIILPEAGVLNTIGPLEFYAVPAAHYEFECDAATGGYAYFGYVIKIGSSWLYHAGDTILYDGMVEAVLQYTGKIDLACLPVNGRDGWRERMGLIGNLDGAEALELAARLHTDVLIPMHNDLFAVNHVNISILADLIDRKAPRQKIHWLQPGETYYY